MSLQDRSGLDLPTLAKTMKSSCCVVTIVSANYLAYARVLSQSLLHASPGWELRVLIVDRKTPEIQRLVDLTDLECIFACDLGLPNADRIFYAYDVVELNTALKPTFLSQTFALGYEHVLYLDPDIFVYGSLDPVLNALAAADILLTPHSTSPIMDGLRPSDIDFLRTGSYNLGFIGLKASDTAKSFLLWWESRCLGLGFNDPTFGIFVDQKWIDLAPTYFSSCEILRHPGCNVAYWNIHARHLDPGPNGSCLVNGQKLIFFHFSGVVPHDPNIFSKHQNRTSCTSSSLLGQLVQGYCERLIECDYDLYSKIPYTYGCLDNGQPINSVMRRALHAVPFFEEDPFCARSKFQARIKSASLTESSRSSFSVKANSLSFNPSDYRLRSVHTLLRLSVKLFGIGRILALLRYLSLLTREFYLASVLLNQPLDLTHQLRR